MKHFVILLIIILPTLVNAQFTGTDSLRNYNNRYITTNPATAFTNNRLNTLLRGIIDFIDTARAGGSGGVNLGIDTVFAVNDSTIRYRKNGVFRQFTLNGVYDSRRKVDTIYKSNDTTLTFTINGNLRTVIIPGGTNLNLATANQTATGNRTHNWDNHWLFINNIKTFGIYQDQPDANHTDNNFKTQITTDSTVDGTPLQLMWGLRNIDDDPVDSLHFELRSTNDTTYLHHYTADSAKSVKIDMNAGATNPDVQILTNGNSKSSTYRFGNTTSLNPADSVLIKSIPASTSDTILATRAFSNGVNTVIKIPASAIAGTPTTLTNVGTGFAWATTPNGSIKRFNPTYGLTADSSTSGTISLKADTSSTNHLVTQSDLNDAVAGVTSGINQLTGDVTAGPGSGSQAATIANNAVTTAKINNGAVTIAKISATGTADNTTFLRGDGAWATPPAGGVDSAGITHDSLYTNSNTVKVAIPFSSFRNRRVAVQVDTLFTTSTSLGTSYGLANSNQGNFEILADRLKMTLLNHSMGGLDIEAACYEVSNNIRPGVNKYMQVFAGGYNLLRYAGNNDSAYKQLQDGIRSIIGTNLIDTIFYGNNARITQHGTWGTTTYNSYGGKSGAFGGLGLYSNTLNDSLKINITGDAIIVGYINQIATGGESGTFNIYVDNVLRKTINAKNACGVSDGTYTNQTTPGAVLVSGLGAGMHTVRIVNTQAKYIYFDYIATTKATNKCAPVIISLIPKMTAAGYAVSPSNANDAIFNKGDSVIMEVVNEFSNYPATVSYPNDHFNPVTMTQGDNVHPTEDGQAALAYANSIQIFTGEKIPAGSVSQWSNTSGGIYYPSGNVGIGSTATSPATALQLKSAAPAFRIDDTNGDNAAFYSNFTNFAQLAINRNPSTGTFTNSGKAAAQISLKADAGEGSILFYATNTNNTSPSQHAIMDGLGNWGFGSITSPTARLHLPGVTTSAGSAPIKLASGTLMSVVENGAIENDGTHLYYSAGGVRYQLDQQGGGDGNGIYGGNGSLPSDVTVSTAGNTLTVSGSNDNETSFSVTNTGTTSASAIAGTASGTTSVGVTGTSSSYIGVFGNSTSNSGVHGQSSSGVGVLGVSSTGAGLRAQHNPSSNNAIENTVTVLRTSSSGAGANGLGAAIQIELETATNGTSQIAGSWAFKWTDATNATRTSMAEIYGVNSGTTARKAALAGNGQWTWDTYGSGTHTGTPTATLQTTSAGNIIEGPLVASGTWSPTLTDGTNSSGASVSAGRYTRVGNIVTFSLTFTTTTSSGASATTVTATLPVASDFTTTSQASGTNSGLRGSVTSTTGDLLSIDWTSNTGGSETITITGQYIIL